MREFLLKNVIFDLPGIGEKDLAPMREGLEKCGIAAFCASEKAAYQGSSLLVAGRASKLLTNKALFYNFYPDGAEYVFEGSDIPHPDELTPDYLERVYRRIENIPWDILETDRLVIKETSLDDLDAFYEIYADPEITRYTEDLFADRADEEKYTIDYRENIYKFYGFGMWTVMRKVSFEPDEAGRYAHTKDCEIIGRAGISYREGFDIPELGFIIGTKYQRQGYAYEACRACIEYVHREHDISEVQSLVYPDNSASVNLCMKLGMHDTGEMFEGMKIYRMSV